MKLKWRNEMKVAIGLPCSFPMVYEDFMASILTMDKTGIEVELFRARTGHDIAMLRNDIVRGFLKSDCSHLLQIDSDMIVHKNALICMLQRDVDIVGALYFMRYPPFAPCSVRFKNKENDEVDPFTIKELQSKELLMTDRVGTGCMLIKREVLENVKYPWFNTKKKNMQIVMSDDYFFCDKARETGFKIFVDTAVPCQHLSNAAIDIVWYIKFGQHYKRR